MRALGDYSVEILRSNEQADMDCIAKLNEDGFEYKDRMLPQDTVTFLLQPNAYIIVARNEHEKIIGKANLFVFMLDHGKKIGLVHNVAVLKEWYRRGVATAMEAMWCEIAKSKGCVHIDLTSRKEDAIAFYFTRNYTQR